MFRLAAGLVNLNREIRAANSLMKSIRQLIQNLKGWITELGEKRKELLAQKAAEEATLLPNLLMKYMEIRKEERKDWTRAGQNRGCLLYTSLDENSGAFCELKANFF